MSRKVGMINMHNVKNHKDHFEVKSVRGTWVIHWLQCQTLYTKSVWPNDSIIEVVRRQCTRSVLYLFVSVAERQVVRIF